PQLAEPEPRPHAAVVELHALADAVRPTAENDDAPLPQRLGLVLVVVGAVEVWSGRRELAGAGVHGLVGRMHAQLPASRPELRLGGAAQRGELPIAEPHAL